MNAAALDGDRDAFATGRTAALALWLPVLAPLAAGMFRDCGHCAVTYLLSLPLVPGTIVPALLRLDDAAFVAVAGLATLAAFAGVWWLLARLRRPWTWVVQAIVALLVAFEAIGYANALRA